MGIDPSAFIHTKAHVGGVTIGARTKVWQFASVIRGASVGDDCNIANGALIDGAWIGDRCIVSQCVAMGPGFLIGDDVFIGPNVVFCNDMWPRVSKDGFYPKGGVIIHVKDGASVGANATLLPGIVIGENAMVAAGAVASVDVPDGHLLDRSGSLRPIKDEWRERRMRFV